MRRTNAIFMLSARTGTKKFQPNGLLPHFAKLKPRIQAHICLENDDTTFTARETLEIAQTVGVPCVLYICITIG